MDGERRMTVNQLAFRVKRSPKTIYRWRREGFLKEVIKVRDGYLIPEREVNRIERRIVLPKK